MKKFFVFVSIIVVIVGAFAIYQHSPRSPHNRPGGGHAAEAVLPTDQGLILPLVQLEGEWYYEKDGTEFKAVVAGREIKVDWTSEGDVTGLYWHGTFETAESPTVTLQSQKIELPDEIVLSQDATKDFRITQDGAMTFQFSALGFTRTIELRR